MQAYVSSRTVSSSRLATFMSSNFFHSSFESIAQQTQWPRCANSPTCSTTENRRYCLHLESMLDASHSLPIVIRGANDTKSFILTRWSTQMKRFRWMQSTFGSFDISCLCVARTPFPPFQQSFTSLVQKQLSRQLYRSQHPRGISKLSTQNGSCQTSTVLFETMVNSVLRTPPNISLIIDFCIISD